MLRHYVLFVLLFYFSTANGLKCYTCSSTESDYDDSCVSSPSDDSTTNCNKKYCNIVREEDVDPKGKLSSFVRGCSDEYLSGKTVDQTHIFYQMSCRDDLCNFGDGKSSSNGNTNYIGDKSTIYCPGSDSSNANKLLFHIPLFLIMIVFIRFI
ncbi:hypothetical protein HHI36_020618 [Cryptolaemus montrouzieri]|uniref:Uncharacterized protein n=1 Tax=Cryptolaemus montrouzieri TaxID=559131 RepID=A0ABD2NB17_9CUCU